MFYRFTNKMNRVIPATQGNCCVEVAAASSTFIHVPRLPGIPLNASDSPELLRFDCNSINETPEIPPVALSRLCEPTLSKNKLTSSLSNSHRTTSTPSKEKLVMFFTGPRIRAPQQSCESRQLRDRFARAGGRRIIHTLQVLEHFALHPIR
jgi:hypothetical protein